MPIYAYKCATCGHAADSLQKMSDPAHTICPACGAETYSKQLTAPQFLLKGSGWYVTDFRGGADAGAKKEDNAREGEAKEGNAKEGEAAVAGKPAADGAAAKPATESTSAAPTAATTTSPAPVAKPVAAPAATPSAPAA